MFFGLPFGRKITTPSIQRIFLFLLQTNNISHSNKVQESQKPETKSGKDFKSIFLKLNLEAGVGGILYLANIKQTLSSYAGTSHISLVDS